MSRNRFLNQKLGKRTSRRAGLVRAQLTAARGGKPAGPPSAPFARAPQPPVRLPKKGSSREG